MEIRIGDITTVTTGYILHGVNLQNTMGSGVARALYTKWSAVKAHYHAAFGMIYPTDTPPVLGQVQYVRVAPALVVVNCFTQQYYGHGDKRYASPDAIQKALETVMARITIDGTNATLHMPRIGCDLGGLSFEDDLLPIIKAAEDKFPDVKIVLWEIDRNKISIEGAL